MEDDREWEHHSRSHHWRNTMDYLDRMSPTK